ncbi:MAG: DUF3737 family protein [Treponema socranskii subsp. buccale]
MEEIKQKFLTGERALFQAHDMKIIDTIFADGESPLKHASDIELDGCMFKWKYPLWYGKGVAVKNCTWFETARAGVWYTDNVTVEDSVIEAPKNFRRCRNVRIINADFPNAAETFWSCDGVVFENVRAKGDYFAMNSRNMKIDNFILDGNYPFDGAQNIEINNSKLISKDALCIYAKEEKLHNEEQNADRS